MLSVPARRLLFWAAVAFSFVMAILPYPPDLPGEPNDKVQHIAAFATLAALGAYAYSKTRLWQLLTGLSAYGALIEIVQAIPALRRDSDIKDWVADTMAAGAILLFVWWRRSRRSSRARG
jgi:VanZ family protein